MATDGALPAPVCTLFHRASELIGRRWTGAIIYVLLRDRSRFAALRAVIPGITDRMLSERLQELEQEGIVARVVFPETPVRVEYSLTEKGRALATPIEAIGSWAHDWLGGDEAPGAVAAAKQRRTRAASTHRRARARGRARR